MKLNIYSIFDQKAGVYFRPFYEVNDQVAIRKFGFAINDYRSDLAKSPEDYTLFYLGTFDDNNGALEDNNVKSLGNGVEYASEELQFKINFESQQSEQKIQMPPHEEEHDYQEESN